LQLLSISPDGRQYVQDLYQYNLGDLWVAIAISGFEEDIKTLEQYALSLRKNLK
jgi:hypothetical protein